MDNSINMGDFDELVTIQQCTISTGTQGNKTKTFTDYLQVWANMEASSDESIDSGNLAEGHTVTMTCHKIAELTSRWRVKWHESPYEILSIDPIDRLSPYCHITLHAIDR